MGGIDIAYLEWTRALSDAAEDRLGHSVGFLVAVSMLALPLLAVIAIALLIVR